MAGSARLLLRVARHFVAKLPSKTAGLATGRAPPPLGEPSSLRCGAIADPVAEDELRLGPSLPAPLTEDSDRGERHLFLEAWT